MIHDVWVGLGVWKGQGYMLWGRFEGDAEEHGSGGGAGGAESGFVSMGGAGWEVDTGDPEVDNVVETYLNTGECTAGWVILVDGERVC